ncbi:hypothetical protein PENTCL1PPCAC_3604, partial [Pristionchus entomophagus]
KIIVNPIAARITDVNEKDQSIGVMLMVAFVWTDYRLKWNPTKFGGINRMVLAREGTWRPPIAPWNMLSFSSADVLKPTVQVHHTGEITDMMNWNFRVAVNMLFHDFPFDRQSFFLRLGILNGIQLSGTKYFMSETQIRILRAK